jgi:predicted ArsR family transcriptional regulator
VGVLSTRAWLEYVERAPEFAGMREEGWWNLQKVAAVVAGALITPEVMTSMPLWQRIVDEVGISWETVGNHLQRLEMAGYLGIVGTGRAGTYQPGQVGQVGRNDAAVYVMCVPKSAVAEARKLTAQRRAAASNANAQTTRKSNESTQGLIPPTNISKYKKALHKPSPKNQTDALRAPDLTAPSGYEQATHSEQSKPRRIRRTSLTTRALPMARLLQDAVPALRKNTTRTIAWAIRDHCADNWTLNDLIRGLHRTPGGALYHLPPLSEAKNPALAAKARLDIHRHHGTDAPKVGRTNRAKPLLAPSIARAEKRAAQQAQAAAKRAIEEANDAAHAALLANLAIEYPGLTLWQITLVKTHDAGEHNQHQYERCPKCLNFFFN